MSRNQFAALAVDAYSSESDSEPPRAAPTTASTTPSKKALARKRAALRKKASHSNISTPGSTAGSLVPPVPTLPKEEDFQRVLDKGKKSVDTAASGLQKKLNGVASKVTEGTSFAEVSKEEGAGEKDVPIAATTTPAPIVQQYDGASSSDAETVPDELDYDDDESDDDLPLAAAAVVTTNGHPSTPPPSSPSGPSPPLSPLPPNSPRLSTSVPNSPSLSSPTSSSSKDKAIPYTGADHDPGKKLRAIITRTVWGLAMVTAFIAIVCLGQVYVIILVFVCQAAVFSELSGLFDVGYSNAAAGGVGEGVVRSKEKEERRRGRREERDRWSRRMSWYFFAATNYFLYGESLIYYFKHILTLQASFLPSAFSFAQHHRLISFGLYIIGFVSFVANLTRAQLRRQFGLFGWIHMSLLLIVVSSHFIVNNILEGLIWVWVPASLVIMNDIAAYVCGMAFGRHQLIKLSPKKTVEGFVGAFFVTIVFAVIWGTFFMRFNYMICPVQDLATNVLTEMHCVPNRVFVWKEFPLPAWAVQALHSLTRKTFHSIPWAPFQLHCVVMAIFASLVAPFGGFFASGFKRAFNIKDFGASIPGHGGMTDRMDCQFLMGLFSYVYYASLIRESHLTVSGVLATIKMGLSTEEQLELVGELGKYLAQKGIRAAKPW